MLPDFAISCIFSICVIVTVWFSISFECTIFRKCRKSAFRFDHISQMVPKFRKGDLVVLRLQEMVVSDTSSKRIFLKCFGRVGTIENVVNYVFGIDYDVKLSCDGSDYVIRVNEHDLGEFHTPDYSSMYSAIKKSHITDCEIRTDGVFYVLEDGSRWNIATGEKVGDPAERIDSVKESKSEKRFCNYDIFGCNFDKSWLKSFEDLSEKIKSDRYSLRVDLGNVYPKMPESKSESKPESKMTKERCIKLLEAYRAEREKIAKGRKFERCLRACVVDEALEKAIELLKGGMS